MDSLSSSGSSVEAGSNSRSVEVKEKSKRPQLSCRNCRNRKVKCDRVQPCTACSLHQIAHECAYDLTEEERQPILQAEALRQKDKEIERLRNELAQRGTGHMLPDNSEMGMKHRPPPHGMRGLPAVYQHFDGAYEDPELMMTRSISVTQELADMSLYSKDILGRFANTAGSRHRSSSAYPFPTLWGADEGISALYPMLPPRHELFAYLNAFEKRAVGVAFPYAPKYCSRKHVERFLANLEHHAEQRPDILALLFAAIAQGVFYGALDRHEGMASGAMSAEIQKGSVFMATAFQALRVSAFLSRPSLCTIEACSMVSHFLCDTGKFVDAWVMIGTTVRLAVLAKYHRNPMLADAEGGQEDQSHKSALWWWLLSLDATSSMICGRPLGASTPGDCRPTDPAGDGSPTNTLTSMRHQVTVLCRTILDQRRFSSGTIQSLTDKLSSILQSSAGYLPPRFDWSIEAASQPHWPVDAQVASLQIQICTLIILTNQQRQGPRAAGMPDTEVSTSFNTVLEASRTILRIFKFARFRIHHVLQNWTLCQAAFNAAMLLIRGMCFTGQMMPADATLVSDTCNAFGFIHQSGIHSLAGTAANRIWQYFHEYENNTFVPGDVLSKDGMALIEGNDLQDSMLTGYDFGSADSDMSSTHDDRSPPGPAAVYLVSGQQTAGSGVQLSSSAKDKSLNSNSQYTAKHKTTRIGGNQNTPLVSHARPSSKRTPRKGDKDSGPGGHYSHSQPHKSRNTNGNGIGWPSSSAESHAVSAQSGRQWSVSKKQHQQASARHGGVPQKPRPRGTGAAASQYMTRELSGHGHGHVGGSTNTNAMGAAQTQYLPNDVLNAFPNPPSTQMGADASGQAWEELASQLIASSNSQAAHNHNHLQVPLNVGVSMPSVPRAQQPLEAPNSLSLAQQHSQAQQAATIAAQHVFTSSSHTYSQPQSPALWGFHFPPPLEPGLEEGQVQDEANGSANTPQGLSAQQEQQILFPGGVTDPRYFWGLEDDGSGTQHFWGG